MFPLAAPQHGPHLGAREDGGEARGTAGPLDVTQLGQVETEDVAVEKQQSGESRVLGRGRDVPVDSEVPQVGTDLLRAHRPGMAAGMEPKETTDGEEVTLLRAEAQMSQPGNLPGTLQEGLPLAAHAECRSAW